jgi:hypothetical protein
MYNINADTQRNRLYITLVGFFSAEEIKKCGDETIAATRKLKSGYDVITDITQFKPGTAEVAKDIERVQTHFAQSGARQGVRVVGQNSSSNMQFSRVGKIAGYQSTAVTTLQEAEAFLNSL